jgi:hypothetical protein
MAAYATAVGGISPVLCDTTDTFAIQYDKEAGVT